MAKRWGWVVTVLLIVALVAVPTVLIVTDLLETNFGKHTAPAPDTERGKPRVDLWELVVIPLALAGIVAWFSWFARQRAQEAGTESEPTPLDTEPDEAVSQPWQPRNGEQGGASRRDGTAPK